MVTLHRQGCPGASDFTNVCCFLLLGLSLFPTTSSAAVLYTEPHRSRSSSTDSSDTQVTSEAIERLSKVFGIDKPPIRIHHRAPPQYMVDLYNSIAYQSGITKHKTPYDADVVRGLPDRDIRQQVNYFYNVSYIKPDEKILVAEFRIFKLRPHHSQMVVSAVRRAVHVIQLRVYQVLDKNNVWREGGLRLLDQKQVSAHAHGWEVFKVTRAVTEWANGTAPNYGLLVTATSLSGDHINGSHIRFAQRSEHHDSKQPVLVVFTDDGLIRHPKYISPNDSDFLEIQREHDRRQEEKRKKKTPYRNMAAIRLLNEKNRAEKAAEWLTIYNSQQGQDNYDGTNHHRTKRGARRRAPKRSVDYYKFPRRQRPTCARHELYVDFEEIGWSGWIISPKGYNAYHCKGDCPFPLGQNQKPTNHATVQSIVHALKIGKDVSTPCCVPNKLYSISLLYFDDDENVILKQYDDMMAASCGCH